MWFRTGVLSDKQIKRLLGKKIFIYPFNEKKLKGSTYNLTASIVARSRKNDGQLLLIKENKIMIPEGDTALIQTEESLFVSKDICGTYHSRVTLVSKGLSHIGTTLDPMYFGTSLIAIHNHTDKVQYIEVGESFVSLMFHKMPSSTKLLHDNKSGRTDILDLNITLRDFHPKQENDEELLKQIEEWKRKNWRIHENYLIEEVKKEVKKRDKSKKLFLVDLVFNIILPIITILLLTYFVSRNALTSDQMKYFVIIASAIFPLYIGIGNLFKNYLRGE
ncbi:hypothetical protein JCM14036_30720 [Desulfotomaculum defluvii]